MELRQCHNKGTTRCKEIPCLSWRSLEITNTVPWKKSNFYLHFWRTALWCGIPDFFGFWAVTVCSHTNPCVPGEEAFPSAFCSWSSTQDTAQPCLRWRQRNSWWEEKWGDAGCPVFFSPLFLFHAVHLCIVPGQLMWLHRWNSTCFYHSVTSGKLISEKKKGVQTG